MKYLKLILSLTLFFSFSILTKAQSPSQGLYGNIADVSINYLNLDGSKIKLSNGTTTSVKFTVGMTRSSSGANSWYPVDMKIGLGYLEGNNYKFFDAGYTFKGQDFPQGQGTLSKEITTVVDHSKLPAGAKIYVIYENHRPDVPESGWRREALSFSGTVKAYEFVLGTTTPGPGPGDPVVGVPPAFTAPEVGSVPLYEYISGNKRRLTTVYYSSYPGFTYNGILGYVFTEATTGTVPLNRYIHPSNGNYYYTPLNTENSGYIYDGIVCYVYENQGSKTFPIYQNYSSSLGSYHRYSNYPDNFPNYVFNGAKFYILQNWTAFSAPVFVYYNNSETGHAYSISPVEYPFVQNGWNPLGINFYAFPSEVPGTFPVHYWYHPNGYDRVLTINNNDFPYQQEGYIYQRIAFYAYKTQVPGSSPVYVFYHNGTRNHVYTINPDEYPYVQDGYVNLGVNFYAIKP
uniref:hypothetical protein n=1 Tax=Pedobacter schmidteae TaxID=2201271 RepID=UPI000EB5A4FC|nr:hypothetical protein [Pedobacter schmidteae]